MKAEKWIETKKECDVDAGGNHIVKKVTLEPEKGRVLGLEKKDFLDLTIRVIGLGAIFTPILFFYLSQKAEARKQKAIMQFDVYAAVSKELKNLANYPVGTAEFEKAEDILLYELSPKLVLLYDKNVSDSLSRIALLIDSLHRLTDEIKRTDSAYIYANRLKQVLQSPDSVNLNLDELRFLREYHSGTVNTRSVAKILSGLKINEITVWVDISNTTMSEKEAIIYLEKYNQAVLSGLDIFDAKPSRLIKQKIMERGEGFPYITALYSGIRKFASEEQKKLVDTLQSGIKRQELLLRNSTILQP